MNVYQLRQFAKIAETCNISRAADELNLTQQALSHAINNLERELGADLFIRKPRGLELTEAGQRIQPVVQSFLSKYDSYMEIIRQIATDKFSALTVCFEHVFNSFIIPPEFLSSGRGFHVSIIIVNGIAECIDYLQKGKADIGIVHYPGDIAGFDYLPIIDEPPQIIMSEHDPLAKKDKLTVEDLRDASFIIPLAQSPFFDAFIDSCISHGFYPKTVFESSDMASLKRMVSLEEGVLLSASFGLSSYESGLVSRPLVQEGLRMQIGFLLPKDTKIEERAESFISDLRALYAQ